MDLREIHPRRPWYPWKSYKQRGTRDNVHVLHGVRDGTGVPEISMVEKTSHHCATGNRIKLSDLFS